jgi:hypothetical protein
MIIPSATDVLGCIEGNIVRKVEPAVSDPAALSALATIKHLLRNLRERIMHEGQVLTDEIAALRDLLPELAAYFAGAPAGEQIALALAEEPVIAGRYRNLDSLAAEALRLRESLHAAIAAIHADDAPPSPECQALRTKIRAYIVAEIADEMTLVEPAFTGRGPRR